MYQATKLSFSGDANNLLLSHDLYLGGLPPNASPHPPKMWSATMETGFVGCLRDVVIDGSSVQLADLARSQDLGRFCSFKYTVIENPSIVLQALLYRDVKAKVLHAQNPPARAEATV